MEFLGWFYLRCAVKYWLETQPNNTVATMKAALGDCYPKHTGTPNTDENQHQTLKMVS